MQPVRLIMHRSFTCSNVHWFPLKIRANSTVNNSCRSIGTFNNGCKHQAFEEAGVCVKVIRIRLFQSARGHEREGEHLWRSVQENLLTPREHLKASAGSDDEIIQPRLGLGLGFTPPPGTRVAYALTVRNSHWHWGVVTLKQVFTNRP